VPEGAGVEGAHALALDVPHSAAKTQRQGCAAGAGGRPSIEPA